MSFLRCNETVPAILRYQINRQYDNLSFVVTYATAFSTHPGQIVRTEILC
jgi:hypothetical protein